NLDVHLVTHRITQTVFGGGECECNHTRCAVSFTWNVENIQCCAVGQEGSSSVCSQIAATGSSDRVDEDNLFRWNTSHQVASGSHHRYWQNCQRNRIRSFIAQLLIGRSKRDFYRTIQRIFVTRNINRVETGGVGFKSSGSGSAPDSFRCSTGDETGEWSDKFIGTNFEIVASINKRCISEVDDYFIGCRFAYTVVRRGQGEGNRSTGRIT